MVEDEIKLLAYQQTLEQEHPGKSWIGASVNQTVRMCVVNGLGKKADKVKSDFKVPDKRFVPYISPFSIRYLVGGADERRGGGNGRFWYVKLKALIEVRDWDGLESFAKSKKSPIGYEPFVELLVAAGSQRQALGYVGRCEARNRVELNVKCGDWVGGGQECVRRGDRTKLLYVDPLLLGGRKWKLIECGEVIGI